MHSYQNTSLKNGKNRPIQVVILGAKFAVMGCNHESAVQSSGNFTFNESMIQRIILSIKVARTSPRSAPTPLSSGPKNDFSMDVLSSLPSKLTLITITINTTPNAIYGRTFSSKLYSPARKTIAFPINLNPPSIPNIIPTRENRETIKPSLYPPKAPPNMIAPSIISTMLKTQEVFLQVLRSVYHLPGPIAFSLLCLLLCPYLAGLSLRLAE